MAPSSGNQHHLVLVGGGHSHVEVLREWARRPVPGVRLSVVTDGPRAVYSGMDGRAVAVKWGMSAEGGWAWRLKDEIDRRFVRRYQ